MSLIGFTVAKLKRRAAGATAAQLRKSDVLARIAVELADRGKIPVARIPADVLAKVKLKQKGGANGAKMG